MPISGRQSDLQREVRLTQLRVKSPLPRWYWSQNLNSKPQPTSAAWGLNTAVESGTAAVRWDLTMKERLQSCRMDVTCTHLSFSLLTGQGLWGRGPWLSRVCQPLWILAGSC